ncbi:guanine nucleotide exchange protein SMCR8-like [Babylonia areolata]|uniref:guanine nucleotide exchange protein SMCR8-like n=1 Tax=Babylonia areolata TaxID=304850 RepID=UPI003FD2FCA5
MFGEYAQIATYLPSSRDTSGSGDLLATNLPPHLLPVPPMTPPLWPGGGTVGKSGRGHEVMDDRSYVEDFVMVAEFSEIEGPKPVLTIPKDAGSNVDKNALSVKLMAVDHQTSSEGFSISEDTQVVLSDDESGVSAFVHHFVLYDNQARGFVRPYCMVFISQDIRKIMMFYEELSSQFKRAARFLKYGNRLLFVKDLERHLQDLEHTKGYMLNQVGRMRMKEVERRDGEQSKVRSNAENELYKALQNIRQSTTEIKDILTILKPILHDQRLENRFRALEEKAFQHANDDLALMEKLSLQEDWFAVGIDCDNPTNGGSLKDTVSPVCLFKSASSHTPLLVETKKAKRFNSPLRGLHELCSWGAKEGLRKLRCIHEYFKRDAMVLEVDKNESQLMEPTNSMILHGHCVTSNVLAGVLMRGSPYCVSEDSSSFLSGDKLKRWPSIASDDTLESFKSVESYLSIQDEENASLFSFVSNNSSAGVTTSASAQDFLSAPTSPMVEEVAFPSAAPSLTTSSITTASSTSLPQTTDATPAATVTTQDLPFHQSQSSPSISAISSPSQSTQEPPPLSYAVAKEPVSALHSERGSDSSHELNKSSSVTDCSRVTAPGDISKDIEDSSAECYTCEHDSTTLRCVKDQVRKETSIESENTARKVLQQQQGQGKENGTGHDELTDDEHKVLANVTRSSSSGEKLHACQETVHSDGPDEGSFEPAAVRMPSFVPIMELNPGQKIRATQDHPSEASEDSSSPSSSGEKRLEPCKAEFVESFKSIPDTVSAAGDESCCDVDAVTDSACNMHTASTPSSESCLWKPRNGVYTCGDVISSLGPGRPGYGIHEVVCTYHNLQPVLFSLMTGRTVLVIGPARMEVEVTKVVTALSVFLPETKRRQHCVVDWMNRPLKVTDLTRIRLAGICRSEKRALENTIPTAVKQYSTLMDVERRIIIGPPYQGTMLNSILQQRKSFKTDAQHVAFIHSWLMELSSKAFIFYHFFCLGDAGGLTQCHSLQRHREQYNASICCLMNRLGVRDHDVTIVEHIAERVKLAQLEPHIWVNVDKNCIVHPLTISSRGTQTFRC